MPSPMGMVAEGRDPVGPRPSVMGLRLDTLDPVGACVLSTSLELAARDTNPSYSPRCADHGGWWHGQAGALEKGKMPERGVELSDGVLACFVRKGGHAGEALPLAGHDGVVVVRLGVGLASWRNASRRRSRCRRSGCVAGTSRGFGEFLGCLSVTSLPGEQFGINRVPTGARRQFVQCGSPVAGSAASGAATTRPGPAA